MPRHPEVFEIESSAPPKSPSSKRAWWKSRFVLTLGLVVALLAAALVYNRDDLLAQWHAVQAQKKFDGDDPQAAIEHVTRAINRLPNEPRLYEYRAQLLLRIHDVEGALADYNKLVELAGHYAPAYSGRSVALQRLGRHREAIDDLTKAIECSAANEPSPWNQRAYARAIAGLELPEALSDIERALKLLSRDKESADDPLTRSAFLDTRGTIQHLLGKQDAALADLNEALELAEPAISKIKQQLAEQQASPRRAALEIESLDHNLAVMRHHRGLVLQKLDRAKEADADLRRAEELGYIPAKGVF